MKSMAIRKWMVRWLFLVAGVHVLVGGLLPWLAASPLLDAYHDGIAPAFWGQGLPRQAHAMQAWWLSLFGPTVQLMAIWMIALIHLADRQRIARIWVWLMAGLLFWAPQDILVSLRAGYWPHVWVDLLALAVMLPPLFVCWRIDATTGLIVCRIPARPWTSESGLRG